MAVSEQLVNINDLWVEQGMAGQILDRDHRSFGGVVDPENGIAWPNHHAGTPVWMAIWGAALVNPSSAYYHSEQVLERLEYAAQYMLAFQHDDGSISPGWTNFHSPPDTAFVVVGYSQLYLLLEQDDWSKNAPVASRILLFLKQTIPVMITGGCHTPNHRWVLSAALSYLYRLFGDPRLLERAEQWLAEGIDITPDGEWTERSNGIYNAVSDVMFIHTARLLDKAELLEPVRANLEMMIYLIHPSGEIVTDYSGRQDFGQNFTLDSYMLSYYLMTIIDQNPQFAAMTALAEKALQTNARPPSSANNPLVGMLLYPDAGTSVLATALPTHYRKMINGSFDRYQYIKQIAEVGYGQIQYSRPHLDFGAPVMRIREGDTSITMMTETSSLLAIRYGQVRLLGVQIASYFGPGFVPMQSLTPTADGFTMTATYEKGYNSCVPEHELPASAQATVSPWYLLPHQHRISTHTQTYLLEVRITELEHGLDLEIISNEPPDVMTQLSLVFDQQAIITAVDGQLEQITPESQLWSAGTVVVQQGNDMMELTGGCLQHTASSVREASYPRDCQTLLVNVMTPFVHRIGIRLLPGTDV
ncbi:hypothetical protein PQ456_21330 [Paenibacillus kyungheensis]|uniref:Uncharacterized protein n=1 Tax=Paenibacillus kyungheensis TaxID=1452732 RepID=A0AAX3M1E8_9BACL|nr:hypothetical protein [Paenibacillus kyungheensis]WCT55657.1 hypothetical protein PQ456_21330 [Paenibacillus kyungheensis]